MTPKKLWILAAAFIIFIAVAVAVPSFIIYNTPAEITSVTAGNYLANLMNGGYVLEDNGFLFFANPKNRTLTRCETSDSSNKQIIANDCDGWLQVVGDTYYYLSGKTVKSCNYAGENVKTIVENAQNPLIAGGSLFYVDLQSGGVLSKYSIRYEKVYNLGIEPKGQVSFYSSRLYYIAQDDTIHCARSDGSDDYCFIDKKATSLEIDGKYMFYRGTDSTIYAMMLTSDSSVTSEIVKADSFAVQGQYIMYTEGDNLFLGNVNSFANKTKGYEPLILSNKPAQAISIDGSYYYFCIDNVLSRVPYDYTGGDFETVLDCNQAEVKQ